MNEDTKAVIQRSEEWFTIRLGKATASRFKDILTEIRSGEAAQRRNYRAQLVIERLTGQSAERFRSKEMEWGEDTEELARATYSLRTGNVIKEVGFIQHPTMQAGASPDGLVGENGVLEIKCFNTANHIQTLKLNQMPKEHIPQVQGQLWLTGRQWCDFVSFEPTLPENAQFFTQRIPRDSEYIEMLANKVELFLAEVDEDIAFLNSYKPIKELANENQKPGLSRTR